MTFRRERANLRDRFFVAQSSGLQNGQGLPHKLCLYRRRFHFLLATDRLVRLRYDPDHLVPGCTQKRVQSRYANCPSTDKNDAHAAFTALRTLGITARRLRRGAVARAINLSPAVTSRWPTDDAQFVHNNRKVPGPAKRGGGAPAPA